MLFAGKYFKCAPQNLLHSISNYQSWIGMRIEEGLAASPEIGESTEMCSSTWALRPSIPNNIQSNCGEYRRCIEPLEISLRITALPVEFGSHSVSSLEGNYSPFEQ